MIPVLIIHNLAEVIFWSCISLVQPQNQQENETMNPSTTSGFGDQRDASSKKIKAPTDKETTLVSTLLEDLISTRRAWGLWVCLTEIDKVKFPFKFFQNSVYESFQLHTMIGKSTKFAEEALERKRTLLWKNKIATNKETHRKYCNMAHFGNWSERVCLDCQNQKEIEFGRGFLPRREKDKA